MYNKGNNILLLQPMNKVCKAELYFMHFDWQGQQLPVSTCEWYKNYKTKSNLDFGKNTWTKLPGSRFSLDKIWDSWINGCLYNKKKK